MFTLKRRLGYYIFHTYIPTCLIVIMSWISFWIRPDAVPARVTLCVTSLLTLSTQHAQSQKALPPVSYIKAIDIFMSCCTLFVFASLMEYALVNILMTADDKINRELLHSNLANMTTTASTGPSKAKVSKQRIIDTSSIILFSKTLLYTFTSTVWVGFFSLLLLLSSDKGNRDTSSISSFFDQKW